MVLWVKPVLLVDIVAEDEDTKMVVGNVDTAGEEAETGS